MSAPLAFLDIESDGVHPGRKPYEIAIIRREPDGSEVEWQAFVEIDLSTADPFGLRVGRFYERHPFGRFVATGDEGGLGDALLPTQAALKVAQLTHGAHIVGAVPNFDTETLAPLLREHGLLPAWHHRLRCVETLTAGHLGREVGGLSDCADALGIEHSDRHTALGDARTCMAIWDRVMSSG